MKFNEDQYDKIDKYLNGELAGDELTQFENKKNSNDDFNQEIKMNDELREFLKDSPENNLRKNLNMLSDEADDTTLDSGPQLSWLLWLAVPILLASGWWFLQNKPSPVEEKPPVIKKDNTSTIPDNYEIPNQEFPNSIPPDQKQKTPSSTTPPKNEGKKRTPYLDSNQKKKYQKPLIAADYTPNPSLDFLIGNNTRNNDFKIKVEQKINNISITSLEDILDFNFSGKIISSENLIDKNLNIHIFSNKKTAYQNFAPLSTNRLLVQKLDDNAYQFDFQKYIQLSPGLYYYILEDISIEKIHFVEKFEIRMQ